MTAPPAGRCANGLATGFIVFLGLVVCALAGTPLRHCLFECSVWIILACAIRLLTRRAVFAYWISFCVAVFLFCASVIKQNYIGAKVYGNDLKILWDDPWFVIDFAPRETFFLLVITLALSLFFWRASRQTAWPKKQMTVLLLAVVIFFANAFKPDDLWPRMTRKYKANMTAFIASIIAPRSLEPPPEDGADATCCVSSSARQLRLSYAPGASPFARPPNLVVVLLESIFDTNLLKGSGFESPWQQFQAAPMHTPIRGGGTWVAEYAVLHGVNPEKYGAHFMNINLLGPQQKLQGRLAQSLRSLDYETSSIFPYGKSLYGAEQFHQSLGMSEIVGCEELKIDCGTRDPHERMKNDARVFEAIQNRLRQAGNPRFIFATTMTNHSPHQKDGLASPACSAAWLAAQCAIVTDYSERQSRVFEQIKNFTSAVANQTPNTVLIFFGDHIPADVSNQFTPADFLAAQGMQTVTFGYDARNREFFSPARAVNCPPPEAIDVADLDLALLQRAGLHSDYLDQKAGKISKWGCKTGA